MHDLHSNPLWKSRASFHQAFAIQKSSFDVSSHRKTQGQQENCKLAINSQNNCSTVLLNFPPNLHNSLRKFPSLPVSIVPYLNIAQVQLNCTRWLHPLQPEKHFSQHERSRIKFISCSLVRHSKSGHNFWISGTLLTNAPNFCKFNEPTMLPWRFLLTFLFVAFCFEEFGVVRMCLNSVNY